MRLAVSVLAEATTPRLLAERIASGPRARSLVVLEGRGDGAPLVLVHGQAGNVLAFRTLSAALSARTPARPVLGFQAFGVDGSAPPDTTIAAMASRYVVELLEHRPHGPYVVAGYSAGGAVAVEMAVQLEALDQSVLAVALLDADAPGAPQLTTAERVRLAGARVRREGPSFGARWVVGKARRWSADRAEAGAHQHDPVGAALAERTSATITAALAEAQVRLPAAPLVLFRAGELAITSPDDLGWGPVTGRQMRIEWVPGDHRTMFEHPHVERLADRLSELIHSYGG